MGANIKVRNLLGGGFALAAVALTQPHIAHAQASLQINPPDGAPVGISESYDVPGYDNCSTIISLKVNPTEHGQTANSVKLDILCRGNEKDRIWTLTRTNLIAGLFNRVPRNSNKWLSKSELTGVDFLPYRDGDLKMTTARLKFDFSDPPEKTICMFAGNGIITDEQAARFLSQVEKATPVRTNINGIPPRKLSCD